MCSVRLYIYPICSPGDLTCIHNFPLNKVILSLWYKSLTFPMWQRWYWPLFSHWFGWYTVLIINFRLALLSAKEIVPWKHNVTSASGCLVNKTMKTVDIVWWCCEVTSDWGGYVLRFFKLCLVTFTKFLKATGDKMKSSVTMSKIPGFAFAWKLLKTFEIM